MNSINELPDNVAAGDTGHPITHEVIHAGLKDHETRIASTEADISAKADLVGGKVPVAQLPESEEVLTATSLSDNTTTSEIYMREGQPRIRVFSPAENQWYDLREYVFDILGYAIEIGGSVEAKADLVGGKVPTSQIPDIAITDFLGEVASESEMNALSGQKGDWAVRTDTGTQWILISDNEWKEMVSPSSPVQSVAGKTGAVTLAKTDVGLSNVDNTSDANKPVSTAVNTALQGKANSSHTHTIDEVTGLQAGLDGKSGTDHKHAAADITSGTFAIARIPTGTTASTVALGNDARFTDTRTPKAHNHAIADVTGLEDALDGKADLVDGKVPAAQLPDSVGQIASMQSTISSLESRIADLEAAATPE